MRGQREARKRQGWPSSATLYLRLASPSVNEQQRLRLPFLLFSLSTADSGTKGRTGCKLIFKDSYNVNSGRGWEAAVTQMTREALRHVWLGWVAQQISGEDRSPGLCLPGQGALGRKETCLFAGLYVRLHPTGIWGQFLREASLPVPCPQLWADTEER